MRARLRYALLSPRAPRRGAGYIVGLLLAVLVAVTAMLGSMVAHTATTAAAAAILAVTA